ncbi:MAG TPA: hypothetical protein VN924_18310 [Bryobacteraceae bacterium]|nr:hypothetical protein [Bryobacteraceae bacterium]
MTSAVKVALMTMEGPDIGFTTIIGGGGRGAGAASPPDHAGAALQGGFAEVADMTSSSAMADSSEPH